MGSMRKLAFGDEVKTDAEDMNDKSTQQNDKSGKSEKESGRKSEKNEKGEDRGKGTKSSGSSVKGLALSLSKHAGVRGVNSAKFNKAAVTGNIVQKYTGIFSPSQASQDKLKKAVAARNASKKALRNPQTLQNFQAAKKGVRNSSYIRHGLAGAGLLGAGAIGLRMAQKSTQEEGVKTASLMYNVLTAVVGGLS